MIPKCATPNGTVIRFSRVVKDFDIYNIDFDICCFLRYAILDVTPSAHEPLPLWGKMPEVYSKTDKHFARYEHDGWHIDTPWYSTRAEAIEAWNKLAENLNEIEETK